MNDPIDGGCFGLNVPEVIYEQFEDELVAINLETGAYHSLAGAAGDAFLLLAQQATAEEMAEALSTKYAAPAEQIQKALVPFFEQLRNEGLIVPVGHREERGPLRLPDERRNVAFQAPKLDAYHDLDSLFLLDPIHHLDQPRISDPLHQTDSESPKP
jgi:hypothetical protein